MRPTKRIGQAPTPGQPVEDAVPQDAAAPADVEPAVDPAPDPAAVPEAPRFAQPPAPAAVLEIAPSARARPELFTVTGSLIERASLTTPSMVTILRRDELLATGRSMIGDILQQQPSQGNAINAQFNNGGDGSTRIDLRGLLNPARTLTLLNGRRFVPVGTGADASVDLNTIPLEVIERVEILKDGASSVYGSDAIGGVVNIITRTEFDGTEASLYTAQTQRGDGFTFDTSFITGHHTEDRRGNIIFSAGVQRQDPVFAGDREFSKFDKVFDFATGTVTNSGSTATPSGRINTRQIDLNGDGRPDPINICGAGVTFCTNDGRGGFRPFVAPQDLFNFQPDNYLYTPSSRFNAYTAGSFKLRSDVSAFFEASYLHRASDQQLASQPFIAAATISKDSIFNPFGGDIFDYRRRLQEFGPRRSLQSVDTFRTVVGLRGSIDDDVATLKNWKWELSVNLGRTDATQKSQGNLILSRLGQTLGPSFINANGVPTCGTPTAPIAGGCFPMNILGAAGSIDPRAVAYTSFTGLSVGVDQQETALATAHGQIAKLPHGDISAAVSADVRKETGEFTPDPLVATGDTTGAVSPAVSGSTSVTEAAAELQIVPVRDASGLERAELDLAARAFRYDSFGSGSTWSARALIRPIPGVTLRTSYNTAFRAPSIAELFQGTLESFPSATDPCDHAFGVARAGSIAAGSRESECAREGVPPDAQFGSFQQRVLLHGNPNVGAETAKTFTAGVVLESPHAPGLTVSADFWQMDLSQQIQQVSIDTIFANCYDRGIRSFCDQIHRDPALGFAIDFVDSPFTNLGGTKTAGVDVSAAFDHRTGATGALHARAEAQRLINFDVDTGSTVLHGLGVYDLGVYPTLKANLSAAWEHPAGAAAGFNLRFIGDFLECENNSCNSGGASRKVDAYTKVDVFSSFTFGRAPGKTTVAVGVNNVFDRDPPTIFIGFQGDSDAATYDYLGRFFWARVTQQF